MNDITTRDHPGSFQIGFGRGLSPYSQVSSLGNMCKEILVSGTSHRTQDCSPSHFNLDLPKDKVKATKEQCFERKKKKKRYKGTKVQRYKGTNQQILLDMDPSFEKHALCPMSPLCDPMRTLPMPCILPCLQCLQPLISNSQLPFLFFSFSSFLFLLSQLKDHLN